MSGEAARKIKNLAVSLLVCVPDQNRHATQAKCRLFSQAKNSRNDPFGVQSSWLFLTLGKTSNQILLCVFIRIPSAILRKA